MARACPATFESLPNWLNEWILTSPEIHSADSESIDAGNLRAAAKSGKSKRRANDAPLPRGHHAKAQCCCGHDGHID
jgi:hypothetical protein